MHILITDQVDSVLIALLKKNRINYTYNLEENEDEILEKIHDFDGMIVRNRLNINSTFLKKAINLKFIARYGSGMEKIDTQKAKELGITCFNAAEGNANSVGEHAAGMLLSLLHNITNSHQELSKNIWEREKNRGVELENMTIGIIGYGNTGRAFARKMISFDCEIIVYDKYKSDFGNKKIHEVNMETIYTKSDIVSFHVPLNDETLHMFNENFINNMRKQFYLINTSRGKVVSTTHLVNGLTNKTILGACLDVFENESEKFNSINIDDSFNYLVNCPNVIMTPHIAGLSKNANTKLSEIIVSKILALK